jgi:hypothetical protein
MGGTLAQDAIGFAGGMVSSLVWLYWGSDDPWLLQVLGVRTCREEAFRSAGLVGVLHFCFG